MGQPKAGRPPRPKPLGDANLPKRKKKVKAKARPQGVHATTAASQRRRVAKFKDRPPPPSPAKAGARAGALRPDSRLLRGSRSAPALRPRPRPSSASMGIPGDIAPRATAATALVRRCGGGGPSRAWSAELHRLRTPSSASTAKGSEHLR